MKTITEMREEINELFGVLAKQREQAQVANREPNEEERTRAGDILDQIDELEANIKTEERVQETQDRLKKPVAESIKPEIDKTDTRTNRDAQKKRDSFLTFGEQLRSVVRAGSPGGAVDPRLTTRATGLGETIASDGGFLVQSEFTNELLKAVFTNGQIASKLRKISLGEGKNGIKINGIDETSRATGSRWGGLQMYWEAEAGEKTASKPKFRQINLELNKLIGLCYATDELLQDATALESIISQAFADEMIFMIENSAINGSGAGQPLGVLTSAALVTQAKEAGQSAATVVFENITKMWSRLIAGSRPNSMWLVNQDVEPQLFKMGIPVGTGGSAAYLPPGGLSGAPYGSLFGRPVVPVEYCQTVGTAGDIILADFSQYFAIDKGAMAKDMSIHVRFVYDESVFRFVYRYDGQPMLAKPITPFKGSNTLSHFVNLAVRS